MSGTFEQELIFGPWVSGIMTPDVGAPYRTVLDESLAGPSITASTSSFLESAAVDATAWTLSMANHPSGASGWAFSIDSQTPSGKLKITSSPTVLIAVQSNYDAGETGGTVTYRGTKSGQDDVVTTRPYSVTNVLEITLGPLAFTH